MDESTLTIVTAVIALLGVIGTAIASIIATTIASQKNREIEQLKALQDLQLEYDKDLRIRRITSYSELFSLMIVFAKYPEPDTLAFARLDEVGLSFREWFFKSGGLLMTEKTRALYFDIQDGFRVIKQKRERHWNFDVKNIANHELLNAYFERKENHPIPEEILYLVSIDIPAGKTIPENISSRLRSLAAKLRSSMSDDVLTRRETILQNSSQAKTKKR
jgi:DNA-dependent RNA polymerase auxiliary subunit epsilon